MAVKKVKKVTKRRSARASTAVMIKRFERRLLKLKERAKLQEIKRKVSELQNELDRGV